MEIPTIITDVTRRHDFVLLFDVSKGNPNGDPDAGNLPRTDPETMQGLVTDVAIKRKVRDYVDTARGQEQRFKIYVQHGEFLTPRRERVFNERAGKGAKVEAKTGKEWMCDEFFDVRMFGAVMSMKEFNAGQVRGPIQLTFANSIDPIVVLDHSIVGPAQNSKQAANANEDDGAERTGTMGRKAYVPYGLYRAHGFFNARFAKDNGVQPEDLALFWEALQNTWDLDRSAARGEMACRGIYVFTHDDSRGLGNAPAHALFERIEVAGSASAAPRSFADYEVKVRDGDLPAGVTLTRLAV